MADEGRLAGAVAAHLDDAIEAAHAEPSNDAPAPDLAAVAGDPLPALVALDPGAAEHPDLAWAADGGRVLLAERADAPPTFDDDFGAAALTATRAGYWAVRHWYAARPPTPDAPPWRAADVAARLGATDGFLTAMAQDWYRITCDLPGELLDRLRALARAHLDGHEVHDVFALRVGDLREAVFELVSIGAAVAVLELAAQLHLADP